MKNLKKVLALGLSATMVSSMFVTAGAAFTDQKDIKATDAVNMLSALGVIQGYQDGSYKPETVVTRGEMAKMIFVVRNNKVDDSAYQNLSTKFADIKGHWAAGYIKFCESQGIIAGKTATKFDPDAPVTGVEAAKMLLVLSGYTPDMAGLTGSMWSTNTLRWAAEAGILSNVNSALESGLPRQYAAQEIYNTLNAYRVKWSKDSNSFDYFMTGGVKETVGRKYMGIYTAVGTMTSMTKDSFELTAIDKAATDTDFPGVQNVPTPKLNFTKVTTDYSSMLGQKVKVMARDGKTNSVLAVYSTSDNSVYTVAANAAEQDGSTTKIKFGGKSYDTNATDTNKKLKLYTDGEAKTDINLSDLKQPKSGDMYTFIDSNSDNKIDTVLQKTYTAAEVTYVSSAKVVLGNGKTYNFADENIASGLAVGDWVVITHNPYKNNKDIVKADMMTGTVKGSKVDGSTQQYMIDSTWYNMGTSDTVKVGDTVKAVNVNGVLFYIKRTSNAAKGELTDVAVLVRSDDGIGGKQAKLQFFNDTTKVVTIDGTLFGYNNESQLGKLYSYTVSSDKYTLSETINPKVDYYGDYSYGSKKDTYADLNKVGTIDDAAKVILYANKDTKVITGKQLKNLSNAEQAKLTEVNYFTAKVNGLTRIAAVSAKTDKLPTDIVAANNYYGYILSDAYKSSTTEVTYTMWNGTNAVTVTEKNSDEKTRVKNMLIGYKSLSDKNVIDEVSAYDKAAANLKIAALTSVSDDKTKVVMTGVGEKKIDSNTKVFYVDSDAATATANGVIQKALAYKSSDTDASKYINDGTNYVNAMALVNGDTLDVLVVDVQNKIKTSTKIGEVYAAMNTAANAQTATIDNVKASATYGTALNNYVGNLTLKNAVTAATNVTTVIKNASGNVVTPSGLTASGVQIAQNTKTSVLTLTTTGATPAGVYTVEYTADGVTATVVLTVAVKELANANDLGIASATKPTNAARVSTVGTITAGTGYTASVKYIIAGFETMNGLTQLQTNDTVKVIVTLTADDNHTFAADATTDKTLKKGDDDSNVSATKAVTNNGKTLTLTYDLGKTASA